MINDLETELRELRRVGPASELWTEARTAIEKAVAGTERGLLKATNRETLRRAAKGLEQLDHLAEQIENDRRVKHLAVRARWAITAVRPALDCATYASEGDDG